MLAVFCAATFGRSLPTAFRPAPDRVYDYFKEWTTARNVFEGRPAYSSLREAFAREVLARQPEGQRQTVGHFDEFNTHPPATVWLALPVAGWEYADAHLVFNLASLLIFMTGVALLAQGWQPRPGVLDPLILGGLLCASDPFRQSLIQGQPNLVMFGLLAFAWRMSAGAAGSGRPTAGRDFAAGVAIGLATALKLFPGLLGVRALVLRRWWEVLGAVTGFAVLSLATLAVVGVEGYRDYLTQSLPWARSQTNNWGNVSILAFWERLFGAGNPTLVPFIERPELAKWLAWGSSLVLLAGLVWFWEGCRRRGNGVALGTAFAAAVFGMLLLSPMVWVHTLLLAGVGWSILREVREPGARGDVRQWWLFLVIVCLWLSPRLVWNAVIPAAGPDRTMRVAAPWQSLTALSFQTYALLAGVAICVVESRRGANRSMR